MKPLILPLIFLLLLPIALAHQPRLVMNVNTSKQNPIVIDNPEISKAYYGQLKGNPDYYQIVSDKPFNLYLNILVPNIPVERERVFSVEVTRNDEKILLLNGTTYTWEEYFEEFAGDSYLTGPEASFETDEGTYLIKVFNSENTGKYSLAVGEIESFPADEMLKTLFLLPSLKSQFFNKPAYTAYFNMIGVFIFVPIIILIVVVVIAYKLFKKFRKNH